MAKYISEDKIYQISGELALLVCKAASQEDPLKALILLGQVKEYLSENSGFDEII